MRSRTSRNRLRRPVRVPRLLTAGLLAALTLVLAGCLITPPWGTWYTSEDGTVHAVMSDAGCTMNLYARFGVTPLDGDGGYRVHSIMFNKCNAGVTGNVSLTMSTSTNGTTWTALPPVSDQADDGRSLTIHATADSDADGPTWFKVHAAGLASQGSKGWTTGADYGPFKIGPNYASWKNGGEGGNDGSVNNDFERVELLKDLNSSDWDAWAGVSSADRAGMESFIEAQNDADGTEDSESIDKDSETDTVEPEPPVDTAGLEFRSSSRSVKQAGNVLKVQPDKGNWVTIRSMVNALVTGNAKRDWLFHNVSGHDPIHPPDPNKPVDARWGYVANNYNRCGWVKYSKFDERVTSVEPSHGCSTGNQLKADTFASLINCNFCNAGWPVWVKPGKTDVHIFRNIPPHGVSTRDELMPYWVKDATMDDGDVVHWRYVTKDGKWVSIWANLFNRHDGKKGSKWGFVRLADLRRRPDTGLVTGDGLCRGAVPHVPYGDTHPNKEGWPLVCKEYKQPHPEALQ